MPLKSAAENEWPAGRASADQAARGAESDPPPRNLRSDGWLGAYAHADTTEYEFPDEEEENHIVRDVAVFVLVSAFVAFFIIKVFIEKDKPEDEQTPPHKDIPPYNRVP